MYELEPIDLFYTYITHYKIRHRLLPVAYFVTNAQSWSHEVKTSLVEVKKTATIEMHDQINTTVFMSTFNKEYH